MIGAVARKLFGSSNDRRIRTYRPRVDDINACEKELEQLSDEALRARTDEFKKQLAEGKTLDDILVPAFATVREAAKRTLKQRHFDVQMIGGMVLHEGRIAEMKTGEGKTLVATLPVYLNALKGHGVHVITVNDYLARRDAEWMGQIYKALGLTVGVIVHDLDDGQRRAAYNCDVTYGTNNELGFDYLRDNMKRGLPDMVQFGYRLFSRALYQEIKQARALAADQAPPVETLGAAPPALAADQTERADALGMQALRMAIEVLEDLERQKDNVSQQVRADWQNRKALLEESRGLIEKALQQLRETPKADNDKRREIAGTILDLTDALAGKLQIGVESQDGESGGEFRGGHVFAIVDEVDSILIDEARTPLIISGPVADRSEFYNTIDTFVLDLDKADYDLDEKQRTVTLSEGGMEKIEQALVKAGLLEGESLYDVENVSVVHHVNQALRAHRLFQRDKDYIVRNREVVIIDEFTGRMMPGRRYSEGLHQALEAKEHEPIQPENQTLASITFQNYFRMYGKLAGMTGTALTEADEFQDIYNLEVLEIPTNKAMIRLDDDDEVYRTAAEKYRAIITLIEDCKQRGQPVLVGTTSIEKSEQLAEMLRKQGWEQHDFSDPNAFAALYSGDEGATRVKVFAILNARYHEQEAYIVSQAGVPGAITIATNMAGRGTDIQLGGNADMRIKQELKDIPEGAEREARIEEINTQVARLKQKALEAGGLFVLGTERHESRRIDNQLRGRSGRQGDPGHSKFFLSLEDDLMRIFGTDKLDGMLQRLGLKEDEAIVHPWINKALEKAQQKVEARNFDIRKNILKFDNVMNDQRLVVFQQRIELMEEEGAVETIHDMRYAVIDSLVAKYVPEKAYPEQWNTLDLKDELKWTLGLDLPVDEWAKEEGIADEELLSRIEQRADEQMAAQVAYWGPVFFIRDFEKTVLLQVLDYLWRMHLVTLEHLRQVIGLRGYGQRDPVNEYKSEAFHLFEEMTKKLREEVTKFVMRIEPVDAMRRAVIRDLVAAAAPENAAVAQWDAKGLGESVKRILNLELPIAEWVQENGITVDDVISRIDGRAGEHMAAKLGQLGNQVDWKEIEKSLVLHSLHQIWQEGAVLYDEIRDELYKRIVSSVMHIEVRMEPPRPPPVATGWLPAMEAHKVDPITGEDELALAMAGADTLERHGIGSRAPARAPQGLPRVPQAPLLAGAPQGPAPARNPKDPNSWGKVRRNEPCPCGSGKKFKHCHGRYA